MNIPRTFRLLAATSLLAAGCAPAVAPAAPAPAVAPAPEEPPGPDASRYHVLILNGGGNASSNYQSHLLHVKHLRELLLSKGIVPAQMSFFTSDGDDPAPDLAVRDVQPEADFWLLEGTRLEGRLRTPMTQVTSSVPGATLHPATKASLAGWFRDARTRLGKDDILLLYVTDHGTQNGPDPLTNRITLWGDKETLDVRELSSMIDQLDPSVRVVTLMSQCFSGGFAALSPAIRTAIEGPSGDTSLASQPTRSICGFFSSTEDRPAYGCFPENRDKDNVGHSFLFFRGLSRTGNLAAAHRDVLVRDTTPDVPLATTDTFLAEVLRGEAKRRNVAVDALGDEMLRAAMSEPAAWETEIRLLDDIGRAFGWFSPRSLTELSAQAEKLPEIDAQLDRWSKAWTDTLADSARANLDRFTAARPDFEPRLSEMALQGLSPEGARALSADLLAALAPFSRGDAEAKARLLPLHEKSETTEAVAYRMEVRLAVLLRMRAVLTSIAGRKLLQTLQDPEQTAAYESLRDCEDLPLPGPRPHAAEVDPPEPFPSFDDDIALAQSVLPGWMGIAFKDVPPNERAKQNLGDGASLVTTVYPGSPANDAGLMMGDIVVGPPGHPFIEPRQIRAWTMLLPIGQPNLLDVVRDARPLQVTLVPKPFPMKWPALPGPPKVGTLAPPIGGSAYRGKLPTTLTSGGAHLLYFWATWCGPCKAALPELLAFERDRKTKIIAITDEGKDVLDPFFKHFPGAFPKNVASDALRKSFQAYAVSGTPTFVLVDAAGVVQSYSVGYSPQKGIGVSDWTFAASGAAPPKK